MNCIWITLLFVVGYIYYAGMYGTMERTGYNYGISMVLSGAIEVIASCMSLLIIDKIDKKKGLFFCTVMLILCGFSFLLQVVKKNDSVQSVAVSLASLLNTLISAYLSIIQMEAFTTELRTTALAISNGVGGVILILQPFMINWINGLEFHPVVFCAGVYVIFGIFPIFLLKNEQEQ